MGTITALTIANNAWTKVNEATGGAAVRWPSAEALGWINNAQREVVNQAPRAYTKSQIVAIVAGTRQTLAGLGITDGISIVDVPRNFAADGTTVGRAMTKRARIELDDQLPTWHQTTAVADAIHWMYDDRDPKSCYIYPPKTAGTKLEVIYAASPADVATMAGTITLDDVFANAIEWFVLFSFYSKDTTYTKSPQLAAQYWQLFQTSIGARVTNTQAIDQAGTQRASS